MPDIWSGVDDSRSGDRAFASLAIVTGAGFASGTGFGLAACRRSVVFAGFAVGGDGAAPLAEGFFAEAFLAAGLVTGVGSIDGADSPAIRRRPLGLLGVLIWLCFPLSASLTACP